MFNSLEHLPRSVIYVADTTQITIEVSPYYKYFIFICDNTPLLNLGAYIKFFPMTIHTLHCFHAASIL